jgi:hypothetical protein
VKILYFLEVKEAWLTLSSKRRVLVAMLDPSTSVRIYPAEPHRQLFIGVRILSWCHSGIRYAPVVYSYKSQGNRIRKTTWLVLIEVE